MTLKELARLVNQIQERVKDSRPVYRMISDLMVSSAQQNFETEGRPKKWTPLRPATVRFKQKHGWTKILFRSGRLKASITGKDGVTGTSATIGSNLVYARIHDQGGVIIHPNKGGSNIHKYDKRSGKMGGFASKKAAMKERSPNSRMGFIEMKFTGHAMNTAMTMPARPFLLIQPADTMRYTEILTAYWFTGKIIR